MQAAEGQARSATEQCKDQLLEKDCLLQQAEAERDEFQVMQRHCVLLEHHAAVRSPFQSSQCGSPLSSITLSVHCPCTPAALLTSVALLQRMVQELCGDAQTALKEQAGQHWELQLQLQAARGEAEAAHESKTIIEGQLATMMRKLVAAQEAAQKGALGSVGPPIISSVVP